MTFVFIAGVGIAALIGWWFWQSNLRAATSIPVPTPPRQSYDLGQTAFSSTVIVLGDAARSVLEELAQAAHGRGMQLSLAVQPGLTVRCDPTALHAALLDLVANALDHGGATRVLLSAGSHGGRVEIAIADDGAGPDADIQASLLRPAEQLLALHGATMQIDVRARQGSIVTLRLPEAPANPVAPPQPEAAPAPNPPVVQAGPQKSRYIAAGTA